MSRRMIVALQAITFLLAAVSCRGEFSRSECRFHEPAVLVNIEGREFGHFFIARRESEPDSLLFITGGLSEDRKRQKALRIDLATGKQEPDWLPYDDSGETPNPPGYMHFESEYPELHPLIRSKTLRFEYLGRKTPVFFPNRNYDGEWSMAKEDHFTGTRRVMYGNRVLLQQDLVNWTALVGVEASAQIEPDGDRIVLLCSDSKGSWLGIFNRSKLELEQKLAGQQ